MKWSRLLWGNWVGLVAVHWGELTGERQRWQEKCWVHFCMCWIWGVCGISPHVFSFLILTAKLLMIFFSIWINILVKSSLLIFYPRKIPNNFPTCANLISLLLRRATFFLSSFSRYWGCALCTLYHLELGVIVKEKEKVIENFQAFSLECDSWDWDCESFVFYWDYPSRIVTALNVRLDGTFKEKKNEHLLSIY